MKNIVYVLWALFALGGSQAAAAQQPVKKYLTAEEAAMSQVKQWQKTGQAKPIISDDGKVLFPFGQGTPTLTCATLRACDIELEPGEQVVDKPKTGDSSSWSIGRMESGPEDDKVIHVIVKPRFEGKWATNLIVPTDRRVYHINLRSTDPDKDFISRAAFYYPEDLTASWGREAVKKKAEVDKQQAPVCTDLAPVALEKLNPDYKITGEAPFKPVRVFNDGVKTYIQMPASVSTGEMPDLVVTDDKDKPILANYRVPLPCQAGNTRGLYFVVDKVITRAMLVLGQDDSLKKITITLNATNADKPAKSRGWSLFGDGE